jgi:hypothetical protein
MKKLGQEFLLVHHTVDTPFGNDPGFEHFFHGIDLVCLFLLYFPDFAETTAADNIHEAEIILSDLCKKS